MRQQKVLVPGAGLAGGWSWDQPRVRGRTVPTHPHLPGLGATLAPGGRIIINLPAKAAVLLFLELSSPCLKQACPAWHLWGEEHPCHETLDKWTGWDPEIGLTQHLP